MGKGGINPWWVVMVVSLATFMEVLDTTITNVSIRHIGGALGASPEESTWVLTSYLVANGIILPLSGWLSGVFGRKSYFILCIAGFTLASLACGAATSLAALIIFRMVQGMAGGGLQPTQQAIVLDLFPPDKRGQVFAVTGITMIVAPILGPTLGGWLTDNLSWRWVFYINVPVGIFAIVMIMRLLEDPPHAQKQARGKIDYVGLGLIALGLGALQVVLDKGEQDDWFASNFICLMAFISAAALTGAVLWLLRQENPVVDLRLLANRGFATSCVLIFCTGFVLYGGSTLLPLLVQSYFGYDSTLSGLVLSPGGMVVMVLMPMMAKVINRVQARILVVIGLLLCALGMWHSTLFSPDADYDHFVWLRITQVIGLPFLFIPISVLAFQHIPKEKNNKASALFSMFRNIGGSVGIAVAISHVTQRTQQFQHVLVEHLRPSSPVYQRALNHATDVMGNQHAAMGHLYRGLQEQAAILAYIDGFGFLAGLMVSAAVLAAFLLPANKPGGAPAAAAH